MELITEPSHLVSEGVKFRTPIRIAGLLAFSFGLLLFVSMDGGAVDCNVAAINDAVLLTAFDQIFEVA